MSTSIEAISSSAELLLTSAGPTNDASKERLLEIGKNLGHIHSLTVLRIADGWSKFTSNDGVSYINRAVNKTEAIAARLWSTQYIGHVLTGASVETHTLASLSERTVAYLLDRIDLILIPGGNTYQTIRGIKNHKEALLDVIGEGKPYVGESAGSIVAGQSTKPASLEPADAFPKNIKSDLDTALGLLNIDIVMHASGRTGSFAIPGFLSLVASGVLRHFESSKIAVDEFQQKRKHEDAIDIVALNDAQSLSVSGSIVTIL